MEQMIDGDVISSLEHSLQHGTHEELRGILATHLECKTWIDLPVLRRGKV